jgi:hypothetical protein
MLYIKPKKEGTIMNLRKIIPALVIFICLLSGGEHAFSQQPINDSYMGQNPPEMIPEKFMPGVVSTGENFEFIFTISPDGNEILFTRRMDKADVIMASRQTSEGWSDPQPSEALNEVGAFEQHFSMERDRVYFSRMAPPPGVDFKGPPKTREEEAMLVGVWYMDRVDSGWSEPVYCTHGMYVTTTHDGTIYTTDIRGPVGISCSRLIDGEYSDLQMLGGGVNDPTSGAHPGVDPDEAFIVFDSEREGGYGKSDLYVCFRQAEGDWSNAINLGEVINTEGTDFCPSLSPDGRYLFYSSEGDIYWVGIQVIENLRPEK